MADEAQTVRSINWREVFPFTNLFKAFRVAVHPSKLVLALTALLLIYFGGRILDGLWVDKHLVQPGEGPGTSVAAVQSAQVALDRMRDLAMDSAGRVHTAEELGLTGGEPSPLHHGKARGIFITFFNFEVEQVNTVTQGVLAWEWGVVGAATCNFVVTGPAWLLTWHPLYFFLFGVWFLLTWSIFGGAISRIAAVHVARDEKISVRQAVRFSLNKLLSFIFAPLIPVLILLVIGVVIAACGWVLFHIPILGPIVAAVLFFLALIAGLVMTLVLLGLAGGFNLMYPTVAVEGSDSFDAISRSFSYVFARPWRMLFYTAVAIVYGALTYLFVRFFIWLLLALTHFFVSWWLTDKGQPGQYFPYIWPGPRGSFMNTLVYSPGYEHLKWSEDAAAGIISFWVYLVIGLLGAYAISFYFSANTIIYYLMRREVDATELEDVYVEESEDEFADTAGAGAAAAGGGGSPAATNIVTTTVSSTTVATVSEPADSIPAPSTGSTSAPSGGVTGAAGSADPGGGAPSQSYTEPSSDAPTSSDEPPPQP